MEYDKDGTPIYDRAISSAPLRKLYKSLFSDGVLPNPSTNMQVTIGDGMNVIIHPGFALCNGCLKLEEAERTLAIQASSALYDRIDTVVLRLNDNDNARICDFYIIEGVPATSPVRPTLTRNESVWEIGLADLFIAKNSTAISTQRITDTRYEIERCGIISSISEFDTTTLYEQVKADLQFFKEESETDFVEFYGEFEEKMNQTLDEFVETLTSWLEHMQGQLDEDAAVNLQNQIDAIKYIYTNGNVLYLPNTAASVSGNVLILGTV